MPALVDPYASHLRVLATLADEINLRRVLELGCGHHSTRFFLQLHHLQDLTSLETDVEWIGRVRAEYPDPRLTLRWVEDTADAVEDLDLLDFDLVFVDDGTSADERAKTIRAVLNQPHPTVVVHDAEVPEYAEILEGFDCEVFTDREPWTAVIR